MLKGFITCSGPPASSADSIASRRVLFSSNDRVRVRDVRRLSALGKAELENRAPAKYDDAYESKRHSFIARRRSIHPERERLERKRAEPSRLS